jgi:hypothetical protein
MVFMTATRSVWLRPWHDAPKTFVKYVAAVAVFAPGLVVLQLAFPPSAIPTSAPVTAPMYVEPPQWHPQPIKKITPADMIMSMQLLNPNVSQGRFAIRRAQHSNVQLFVATVTKDTYAYQSATPSLRYMNARERSWSPTAGTIAVGADNTYDPSIASVSYSRNELVWRALFDASSLAEWAPDLN